MHLSNKQTSHALILSNLESNERTSFVNWGCGYDNIKPSNLQTRWKHISYIDILSMTDLDQCRKNSTIMSADVCLSNPNNINSTISKLHYFDYLFISESEFFPLIGDINNIKEIMSLVNMTKLKCIVLHTRLNTHLIYKDNYKIINNNNKIITNTNVLGAGDVYCINFINYQLNNNINDEYAAIHAHKHTTNYIALNKNEKI